MEVETTRDFKIEDGKAVAIKIDKYTNGAGKTVVRTLEEKGITVEEMDEVLNKLVAEETEKVATEKAKITKESEDLQKEIDAVLVSEEDKKSYAEWKEYVKSEKYQKCAGLLSKERAIQSGASRMLEIERQEKDIEAWKLQMLNLKAAFVTQ